MGHSGHDDGVSNTSGNKPFEEVLEANVSRRKVLAGSLALGVTSFLPSIAGAKHGRDWPGRDWKDSLPGRHTRSRLMKFEPVPVSEGTGPMPTISADYEYDVLIPWCEPIEPKGPAAQVPPVSSADQAQQIGIGHDGMAFFPFPGDKKSDKANRRGMLAINHEFGSNHHVFGRPDEYYSALPNSMEEVRISQHAHGVSVVELQKKRGKWQTVNSEKARRIHVNTPVAFSGPVAGSSLLDTPNGNVPLGTVNNCSSGPTPWGTYLTCEENFNGYFGAHKGSWTATDEQARYGFSSSGFGYGWEKFDSRFDLSDADYQNEENRFGWVVEIDPFDATQKPVKRTALGRFKHEGATTVIGKGGRAVVYMGDDERGDYIYKFVSADHYKRMMRQGKSPLDEGTLYVARFNEDGTGNWLPLTMDNPDLSGRFADEADMLVHTRIAADIVGATPMDRPEWTTVAPNGYVYCTLTNNKYRKSLDEGGRWDFDAANPQETEEFNADGTSKGNDNGHIIRWNEGRRAKHTSTTFSWDIFIIAKNTQGTEDVFSDPDGIYADPDGRLFIETDGGQKDGLNNQLLVADTKTKEIRRLFTGVTGDEITGLTMTPDRRTLFINTQHPGNGLPSNSSFPAAPGSGITPRDSTFVIRRKDGGIIGS